MIVAGCGSGSGSKTQVIAGNEFTFEAPSNWTVRHTARSSSAASGEQTLQASVFPLSRAYTPALFSKVQPEIERVAAALKEKLHARLTGRTLDVAGERAWQYDLAHGDVVEQVTFVLRGKREFQLYCRRGTSDSSRPCSRFVSSFRLR